MDTDRVLLGLASRLRHVPDSGMKCTWRAMKGSTTTTSYRQMIAVSARQASARNQELPQPLSHMDASHAVAL